MRKKIHRIFVILVLLLALLVMTTGHPSKGDHTIPPLIINEIAFNTTDPEAVWFELYNPTEQIINLSDWRYSFEGVYCVFSLPPITLKPHGYVVITPSVDNFTRYWKTSISNVYSGAVFPLDGNLSIFRVNSNEKDVVRFLQRTLPLNCSWARYRNHPYTGDFTEDFYLEEQPTPGMPNNKEKGTFSYFFKLMGYITIGILLIGTMVLIPHLVAYRIRKKKGLI